MYARNPWSVRAFGGKLFIASGNSNNKGPAPSAGPVDLFALDPATGKLAVDHVVPEEQVVVMKVFDGKLFAAVSTVAGGTVARSTDRGVSWHEMLTYAKPGERTRTLFVLGGKLYASTSGGRVYRWDGKKDMGHLTGAKLFPGLGEPSSLHARTGEVVSLAKGSW